ncbi:GNAT family N-acetyltransferase [Aliivibrio logei]|uniref:GNAT family N-acetyltransferase n=1 Tax=Aliivibrio logei 5S-186 TaxID=626086 RepID=A0ABX3ASQ0_ALILO|nr:GNAT family N-acetyltransferase [Aliivibrio logei]OEF10073.1 hypothetical protein A1Q5_14045 [Aliivibrio logei 5S-186]
MKISKVDWDNDEIVNSISDLLNDSFETIDSSFFTKDFLRWKHRDNPFGESISYIATDESSKLVGLRTFLKWRFINNENGYSAYQPVDTATSPRARGRGVFSLLTKSVLLETKDKIIFNRPNKNSFPGYIKMGWKYNGNIRFGIIPRFFLRSNYKVSGIELTECFFKKNKFIKFYSDKLQTDKTSDFLIWRFINIPNMKYKLFHVDDNLSFIYKVRSRSRLNELLICDFFSSKDYIENKLGFLFKLQSLLVSEKCHYSVVCFKDIPDGFSSFFLKVPFKKMKLVSKTDNDFIFTLTDVEVF